MAIRPPVIDPLDVRYLRMVHARETCMRALREHFGNRLPPPVVAAVCELSESLLRLGATPDEDLEQTVVERAR